MRLILLGLLCLLAVLVVTSAQDSSEESVTPKRVLKKYRVRRPVVVDDDGNVVRRGKVRRIRVKGRPRVKIASKSSTSSSVSVSRSRGPLPGTIRSRGPTVAPVVISVNPPSPSVDPTQRTTTTTPKPIATVTFASRAPKKILSQGRYSNLQDLNIQQETQKYDNQQIIEPARKVPNYRQPISEVQKAALLANVNYKSRSGDGEDGPRTKAPNIPSTRMYSRINEDGSFTFGYDAADGSFKEETRGIDCVVRGKYGYIDPDGVRREFEYVSGNPCDPNAPEDSREDNSDYSDEDGYDSLNFNAVSRPRQRRPRPEISTNTIQQGLTQTYEQRAEYAENEDVEPPRSIPRQRTRIRVNPTRQPLFQRPKQPIIHHRGRQRTQKAFTFPSFSEAQGVSAEEPDQSIESPRPSGPQTFSNFDSELQRITRPISQPLYEQPLQPVRHFSSQPQRQVFGGAQFIQRHRQEDVSNPRGILPTIPSTVPVPTVSTNTGTTSINSNSGTFGRYRTELVYDQNTGQYHSVIAQSAPGSGEDFHLTQKLRAFVQPQQPQTNLLRPSTFSSFGPQPTISSETGSLATSSQPASPSPTVAQFYMSGFNSEKSQPVNTITNLQFIPPHLRPDGRQQVEIEKQEVRQLSAPNASPASGQIDAFLRSLNIAL